MAVSQAGMSLKTSRYDIDDIDDIKEKRPNPECNLKGIIRAGGARFCH